MPTDPHPARDLHDAIARRAASMLPYGPLLPDGSAVEIAESFDTFEAEYAAIRRHVGIMHLPQRALLCLTGADVKDYLHRLCTQHIDQLTPGQSARSFQLDDKGRIAADLIVHHRDDSTWLELDVFDLPWMKNLLEARLFTEDVTIEDWADRRTFIALLGPAAVRLLGAVAGDAAAAPVGQQPGTHHLVQCRTADAAVPVTAYRWDLGGVLSVRLAVSAEHAAALHAALLHAAGDEPDAAPDAEFAQRRRDSMRGRPVGWAAFNTVRIEEGVPLYHIDFGPDSLPAEVPGPHGIDAAVHFNKGCYLGQEVVARMKSLGHPKKLLVGLRLPPAPGSLPPKPGDSYPQKPGDGHPPALDAPGRQTSDEFSLPVAGTQVLDPKDTQKVIGGITSSAASPLRSQTPLAFAVVRWGKHQPGTAVRIPLAGRFVDATVHPLDALLRD